jgi:hypothetical protein
MYIFTISQLLLFLFLGAFAQSDRISFRFVHAKNLFWVCSYFLDIYCITILFTVLLYRLCTYLQFSPLLLGHLHNPTDIGDTRKIRLRLLFLGYLLYYCITILFTVLLYRLMLLISKLVNPKSH